MPLAVPWVVLHGALVWKLALPVLVLLGLAVVWARARSLSRGEARATRARQPTTIAHLEPALSGPVTLIGRLEGEAPHHRLDVGGETVEITGAIEVTAGSREVRGAWGPLPARTVSPGDRVLASGVLRSEAVGDASQAGYRDAARVRKLAPSARAASVEVVFAGDPGVSLSGAGMLQGVLAGAVGFLAIGWSLGKVADRFAWSDAAGRERAVAWAEVEAATPFHRDRALSAMHYALSPTGPEDEAIVERAAAYERFETGECAEVLRFLAWNGRTRKLAEIGDRCGTVSSRRAAARGWLALGELESSSALLLIAPAESVKSWEHEDVWLDAVAHLLAGHLDRAADAVRAHARLAPHLYDANEARDRHVAVLGCVADALDARRGDREALGRLERSASSGTAPRHCALLHADLLQGSQRLGTIGPLQRAYEAGISDLAESLSVEADPVHARPRRLPGLSFPAYVVAGYAGLTQGGRGVGRTALAALRGLDTPDEDVRMRRAYDAVEIGTEDALIGDTEEARRLLAAAESDVDALPRGPVKDAAHLARLSLLRAGVEIRAGDLAAARGHLARSSQLDPDSTEAGWKRELGAVLDYIERGSTSGFRGTVEYATFAGSGDSLTSERIAGLEIAAGGDGEALARWMAGKIEMTYVPVLVVGARHVKSGHAALLDALSRTPRDGSCSYSLRNCPIEQLVISAENRRLAAEALGGRELAAELGELVRRLREPIFRRDIAVPLGVLLSL